MIGTWIKALGFSKPSLPFSLSPLPEKLDLERAVKVYLETCSWEKTAQKLLVGQTLRGNLSVLKNRGWSESTLATIYLSYLSRTPDLSEVELLDRQASLFGSDLFVAMWQVEWTEKSASRARHLLRIGLETLGFDKGLTQRRTEIAAYLSRMADLSPDHVFWQQLASLVHIAFPNNSLSDKGDLARSIHQLRYLISLQQSEWVRRHYGQLGSTDRQALAAYLAGFNAKDSFLERLGILPYDYAYDLKESSRLHNKLAFTKSGLPVPSLAIPNVKILLHFHSEFILDANGQFANILDQAENGIVNGASFNYASSNGRRHEELDISPVRSHDPRFRRRVLRTPRHRYHSPIKSHFWSSLLLGQNWIWSYFNPKGLYAQDDMSMAKLVKEARRDLAREIEQTRQFLADRDL